MSTSSATRPERLLSIKEVVDLTGFDEPTVMAWLRSGLPYIDPQGARARRIRRGKVRVRESSLSRWLDGLEVARDAKVKPAAGPVGRPKAGKGEASAGLGAWREKKGKGGAA
jgi:predicted DNA-binding transcriptional regulator AlpA